jgi:hypothetical protein
MKNRLNEELGTIKFLIGYNRNKILSEQKHLNETACDCGDGTTSEACCTTNKQQETNVSADPTMGQDLQKLQQDLEQSQKNVNNIQSQIDLIQKTKDAESKSQTLTALQDEIKTLDAKIEQFCTSRKTKKICKDYGVRRQQLYSQLDQLRGMTTSSSMSPPPSDGPKSDGADKTQKWVNVASSILALASTSLAIFKKP